MGRRLERVKTTCDAFPDRMKALSADVGTTKGQNDILEGIPEGDSVKYLVHNAAVGEPGRLGDIDGEKFIRKEEE